MPHENVYEPVPFERAFDEHSDAHAQSQAALLLLAGALLRPAYLPGAYSRERLLRDNPAQDIEILAVSPALFGLERARGTTFTAGILERSLGVSLQALLTESDLGAEVARTRLPVLAKGVVGGDPAGEEAAALIAGALFHPEPLVRAAAAVVHFDLADHPPSQMRALDELVAATGNSDPLIVSIGLRGLARVAPGHPRLAELARPVPRDPGTEPAHTSIIAHGTFARTFSWWQPGGGFHTYLGGVLSDLYSANDRFEWNGGWSDAGRTRGARELETWVAQQGAGGLDIYGHSHGATIAMIASQGGLHIGKLVALSCPAWPGKYDPNHATIGKVVSVRVRWDLGIFIDGGAQRFQDPRIHENVLPIWFNHSATHEAQVWIDHNVPGML